MLSAVIKNDHIFITYHKVVSDILTAYHQFQTEKVTVFGYVMRRHKLEHFATPRNINEYSGR